MPDWFLNPTPPPDNGAVETSFWIRLGWFVLIAVGSGAAVTAAAYVLRRLLFIE